MSDWEDEIDQSCDNDDCEYWAMGGCLLPGKCIYSPADLDDEIFTWYE